MGTGTSSAAASSPPASSGAAGDAPRRLTPPPALGVVEGIVARYEAAKSRASNWRSRWEDAAHYIRPNKGGIVTASSPGASLTGQLFDSTAGESAGIMSAGLVSMITPTGELWFQCAPQRADNDANAEWLDACGAVMADALIQSKFYLAIHEAFVNLATFSLGGLYISEEHDGAAPFAFTNLVVGSFYIDEDEHGHVDTVFRTFEWTARQCLQEFGEEALSPEMRREIERSGGASGASGSGGSTLQDTKHTVLHAIFPRDKRDVKSGATLPQFRPYVSLFVDAANKHVLRHDGAYELPVAVSRLDRGNGEIYGRGPSDSAMPDIKVVNRARRSWLLTVEQVANAPWLVPTSQAQFKPDVRPGGRSFYDDRAGSSPPTRMEPSAQMLAALSQDIEAQRETIRRAFYVPMFQMLSNPGAMAKQKTAFEVSQMVQERLVLFHPLFSRIVEELLDPLLNRCFFILFRGGYFPPPPTGRISFKFDYISKVALAIKATQNQSVAYMLQAIQGLAQFDPSIGSIIDGRKTARKLARNVGLPPDILRSDDELDEIAEQQQQAAMMAQMPQLAGAMKQGASAAKDLGPEAQAQMGAAISGGIEGATEGGDIL
jgi:hypothetical protein